MESSVYSKGHLQEDLPINPFSGKPIILVPKEILRDLPEASNFGDIALITQQNEHLRAELNALIGGALSALTASEKKEVLRKTFFSHPEVLKDILTAYIHSIPTPYNFDDDPSGEVIWYQASKSAVRDYPLALGLPDNPLIDDVEMVVLEICKGFRQLIEDNQLAKLLYNDGGKAKHESAAQLLFFGLASNYCEINNLDISPESDAGRGPVDFKFSNGAKGKVLVEVKLTSNNQLLHGFQSQLPIYMRAEGTLRGVYLVIDNGGYTRQRMERFRECVGKAGPLAPQVIYVDGVPRPSASKATK